MENILMAIDRRRIDAIHLCSICYLSAILFKSHPSAIIWQLVLGSDLTSK